jgi:transposase
MRSYVSTGKNARDISVGIDVHAKSWQVVVVRDDEQFFGGAIEGSWSSLKRLLSRWDRDRLIVAYEAGFSGFWLYDALMNWGAECLVVPPSLIPTEAGSRVKTDRRDATKLALLLCRGLLKQVWVPSVEQRFDREVIRQRRRLVRDRRRLQSRIKSLLHWYGLELGTNCGHWTRSFVSNLWRLKFNHDLMQASFGRLLEEYEKMTISVHEQTELVRQLSGTDRYRRKVELLTSLPGIGIITAMEILTELGDISRFSRADKLSAYVGLTPSQHSSGEHIRFGHITRGGKASLRGMLVESAWIAVRKDRHFYETYQRIKQRAGAKRAIVGIARRLLVCGRAILLKGQPYQLVPLTQT